MKSTIAIGLLTLSLPFGAIANESSDYLASQDSLIQSCADLTTANKPYTNQAVANQEVFYRVKHYLLKYGKENESDDVKIGLMRGVFERCKDNPNMKVDTAASQVVGAKFGSHEPIPVAVYIE